jgi:hypothetical protein
LLIKLKIIIIITLVTEFAGLPCIEE